MTTYKAPIVIGIFQEEAHAKDAVDALRTAGFRYDQVGVAMQSSQRATSDLQSDLLNLGVPQEQASYYDSEYQAGHIVVSIRPDGRENEAQDILSSKGAYNYINTQASSPTEQTPAETSAPDGAEQSPLAGDNITETSKPEVQVQENQQPAENTHTDNATEQVEP